MQGIWKDRLLRYRRVVTVAAGVSVATALALAGTGVGQAQDKSDGNSSLTEGQFQFEPLPTSTPCTNGGNKEQPFVLPTGYAQAVFAREGDGGTVDLWDMNTQNETGEQAGRFLFRTHETSPAASENPSPSQVSMTDLETNTTRVLAQNPTWERFDGIVWNDQGTTTMDPSAEGATTKQTILAAEETQRQAVPDPRVPQAQAGLVYEIDPKTGEDVPRPAVGSRSHEGMRFDPQGNLYGISETNAQPSSRQPNPGGFIYRFVPERPGDLSSGQLFALRIVEPTGDRTGEAIWVPLDPVQSQINSDVAAAEAGATGYNRPEDVEIATSTGNNRGASGANTMYVAITGEDRVLAIDLREPEGGSEKLTAFVADYVRASVNAPPPGTSTPNDFDSPDNLALDRSGNLFITEDPGGEFDRGKRFGDDIFVATPDRTAAGRPTLAQEVVRFASLTDCDAEPTGIYFKKTGRPGSNGVVNNSSETLFVNAQHRGGDGQDEAVAITQPQESTNRSNR